MLFIHATIEGWRDSKVPSVLIRWTRVQQKSFSFDTVDSSLVSVIAFSRTLWRLGWAVKNTDTLSTIPIMLRMLVTCRDLTMLAQDSGVHSGGGGPAVMRAAVPLIAPAMLPAPSYAWPRSLVRSNPQSCKYPSKTVTSNSSVTHSKKLTRSSWTVVVSGSIYLNTRLTAPCWIRQWPCLESHWTTGLFTFTRILCQTWSAHQEPYLLLPLWDLKESKSCHDLPCSCCLSPNPNQ